ncbi:hypothetical protein F0562_015116 [Nyssa sinensis]|uniref:Uncharacterized protein n=1 Tax=Nyssa sinensis TaxID=561372 RepID=A0A5J4ZJG8_9ASTE|nr:hypothetical protein F0562_015116 [Nyssa sinensis]
MMRKKKRQSEREAGIAQRNHYMWGRRDEVEVDSTLDPPENEARLGNELQSNGQTNVSSTLNGLTSLVSVQQASSGSHVLPQATGENVEQVHEDRCIAPGVKEQESGGD